MAHCRTIQSYIRHFASTTKNIGRRHLTAFLSLVSRMENDFYNKTTAAALSTLLSSPSLPSSNNPFTPFCPPSPLLSPNR